MGTYKKVFTFNRKQTSTEHSLYAFQIQQKENQRSTAFSNVDQVFYVYRFISETRIFFHEPYKEKWKGMTVSEQSTY